MKIPHLLMVHHKEPILYLDYCKIRMKDGVLTAISEEKREVIAPAKHLMIFLGAGTSISQEAIIFCGKHNCHISTGRAGCYIHSIWMGGRWPEPQKIVRQSLIHNDTQLRLKYAKELTRFRFKVEKSSQDFFDRLEKVESQEQLLSLEAHWAKELYRLKKIIHDVDFSRDQHSRQGVNSRLTLLNNALYSITTAIILNVGLHPSIGLIHGKTRRGGFSFDLADAFKYTLSLDLAFRYNNLDFKEIIYKVNNLLKKDNYFLIKEMIRVCEWFSGDNYVDLC